MLARYEKWREDAKCFELASSQPFLEDAWDGGSVLARSARDICFSECLVREQCLRSAVEDPEAEGLRGGFNFEVGLVSEADARRIKQEFGVTAYSRYNRRPTNAPVQDEV